MCDPSSVADDAWKIVKSVRIVGLQSKPEYNGQEGVIRSFDAKKERYGTRLAEGGQMLALRRANLALIDPASRASTSGSATPPTGSAGARPSGAPPTQSVTNMDDLKDFFMNMKAGNKSQ